MTEAEAGAPILDAKQAIFLSGPVAINVASHDPALTPSVARGFGCRVSGDLRQVTVFVSVLRSRALLRDLGAGAPIAVVFTRPKTHETLQLAGTNAEVRSLTQGDQELVRAYGEAFGTEIRALGYADYFTRAITAPVEEETIALAFTPEAVFEQTPGPSAGKRLEPRP